MVSGILGSGAKAELIGRPNGSEPVTFI